MKNVSLAILCALLVLIGCRSEQEQAPGGKGETRHPLITELQRKYAPDRRTAIFTVASEERQGRTLLKGEVDRKEAKDELLSAMADLGVTVLDSIVVLPEEKLGERTWGIITVSVANMRSEPEESAELGSQTLMGSIVRVWKRKSGYVYIQSPDRYLGWADPDQMKLVTEKEAEEWRNARKVFFTGLYDLVRLSPDAVAYPVCDVTAGAVFRDLGTKGGWTKVGLADGRSGYVPAGSVIDHALWGTSLVPVPENIERTGRMLMGVPYLWGGTSVKGVDCSGFTKTVFLLNGLSLNRDANQQAEQGTPVEAGKDFVQLKKGDLLFFGRKEGDGKKERITHVGIYLGGQLYIHSSGTVHLNSFDAASPLYNEYNRNRFVRARRVIAGPAAVAEVAAH
ncbi:MAG: hypothetical protein F9K22_02475 [Bacteroidetes bacterium]|nr:MAG: hypothetical protein F9K22_02475 [Bacteroidota bacterium]